MGSNETEKVKVRQSEATCNHLSPSESKFDQVRPSESMWDQVNLSETKSMNGNPHPPQASYPTLVGFIGILKVSAQLFQTDAHIRYIRFR